WLSPTAPWTSSRTRPARSSPRAGLRSSRRWSAGSRMVLVYSARSRPSTSGRSSRGASLRRPQSRRVSPRGGARRAAIVGWLFVAPALLMYAVFVLQPLGLTIQYSLYRWNGVGPATWVGLSNYVTVLRDPDLLGTIINSFKLVLFFSIVPVS